MKRRGAGQPLPLWGYVVVNALFLLLMVAIYFFSAEYARDNKVWSVGLFPVLLTCYLAFTAACVFDAVYDRVSAGKGSKPERQEGTAPREGGRRGEN